MDGADMMDRGNKTRWTWMWVSLLLALGTTFCAHAEPLKLPGRKTDSMEPWGAFPGRAAHEAIGKQYEEIEEHGALAEQAIRGAYERTQRPAGFQGQVYLPVDCH